MNASRNNSKDSTILDKTSPPSDKKFKITAQENTTASKGVKRMYAPNTTLFDPPDVLDPLRAVCDSPDELDS